MTDNGRNPKVDEFINGAGQWKEEFKELRNIILGCGLTEDLKWGKPCYTYDHRNVVLIHGFKEYCALLFIKGALLKDPHHILIQQTENVQAGRQIRFIGIGEIAGQEDILKSYILEALEVEKAGLEVEFKKQEDYIIPEELQAKFMELPALKTAFEALTPGRQRAYIFYFSEARQSKTRSSRIEKYLQHMLNGKGLND